MRSATGLSEGHKFISSDCNCQVSPALNKVSTPPARVPLLKLKYTLV